MSIQKLGSQEFPYVGLKYEFNEFSIYISKLNFN